MIAGSLMFHLTSFKNPVQSGGMHRLFQILVLTDRPGIPFPLGGFFYLPGEPQKALFFYQWRPFGKVRKDARLLNLL
jgi:hypothetical protein